MRNDRSFTLHIPEPDARPGGTPDFSHLRLEPAGAARRPAIDEPGLDQRDMP
jgi:2-oxoisovalerate dehydrogenase E1 component alpha subunit